MFLTCSSVCAYVSTCVPALQRASDLFAVSLVCAEIEFSVSRVMVAVVVFVTCFFIDALSSFLVLFRI